MEFEVWYEEALLPDQISLDDLKQQSKHPLDRTDLESIRAVVRVDRPRWRLIESAQNKIARRNPGDRHLLVRLGFQFDIPPSDRRKGTRYTFARCQAYLWPAVSGEPQPTVYDIIPRDLYNGEPRKVKVTLGPQITIASFEASLGEVSSDITVGTVEPTIVGWPGDEERAPYWDLTPRNNVLLGIRHFWLVVELPEHCSGLRLAAMAEGDLQTHFGPIPVGPRERAWDGRMAETIVP